MKIESWPDIFFLQEDIIFHFFDHNQKPQHHMSHGGYT